MIIGATGGNCGAGGQIGVVDEEELLALVKVAAMRDGRLGVSEMVLGTIGAGSGFASGVVGAVEAVKNGTGVEEVFSETSDGTSISHHQNY